VEQFDLKAAIRKGVDDDIIVFNGESDDDMDTLTLRLVFLMFNVAKEKGMNLSHIMVGQDVLPYIVDKITINGVDICVCPALDRGGSLQKLYTDELQCRYPPLCDSMIVALCAESPDDVLLGGV